MEEKYTIGLDYGTLSARAVLVRLSDGKVINTSSYDYPHSIMTKDHCYGLELDDNWCLQHPQDYIEAMEKIVREVAIDVDVEKIIGIGIDFTSCTMLPIDEKGVPLCFKEEFKNHRNAYVKLWKHHGAQLYADRINEQLVASKMADMPVFGGRISSEVMIPKIIETLEEDKDVYDHAYEFIEAGDWLTRILTDSLSRSISFAGYKAWYDNGYPDEEFFEQLNPSLKTVSNKLGNKINPMDKAVGCLNQYWANRLGLKEGIQVAPAIIDSHAGVPGSGVCDCHQAMLVLGTSSVIIGLGDHSYSDKGIYGNVKDGIVPGYYAYESGLATVGDLLAWFVENQVPYSYYLEAQDKNISIHQLLSDKASCLKAGDSGLLVLDWWNGNKTPYVDSDLKGAIIGLSLATKPEEIYRALIESTAFATRRIIELYEKQGVIIDEIICSGGISYKNPLFMRIYADVLNKPLKVADSLQTAALGSAIYAAICANGGYDSYKQAVKHMAHVKDIVYLSDEYNVDKYNQIYELYKEYGGITAEKEICHRLNDIKHN